MHFKNPFFSHSTEFYALQNWESYTVSLSVEEDMQCPQCPCVTARYMYCRMKVDEAKSRPAGVNVEGVIKF